MTAIRSARTSVLEIAYEEQGPAEGQPIVLLHGFPYDPRGYDRIAEMLAARDYRVLVPYLRGFGPTRFLSPETMRSGQQAALAHDLIELLDALSIPKATLVGYDWGGRAACIVAAMWPERVCGLVSAEGYNIQNIARSALPQSAQTEHRLWYQYYFHSPRGKRGLTENRNELCELLWRLWSPLWNFNEDTYRRTAASFENPDFVDVVIHSYRHRYGYVGGDPRYELLESELAKTPAIRVPTIVLCGQADGVRSPTARGEDEHHFLSGHQRRLLPDIGHNIPQEAPDATLQAILDLVPQT
jgi:pimeloyl-ACP methyl ester carboxylesterase